VPEPSARSEGLGHLVGQQTYDAIVVGSGMTGGWAAKELTEAGLRTLVLERGGPVAHVKDYPTARLDPWELPYGNLPTQQDLQDYPVQSHLSFLFGQDVKHFLVKDVDHPYEAADRHDLRR
jgi:choline dehydrogenase-like flavoprotein